MIRPIATLFATVLLLGPFATRPLRAQDDLGRIVVCLSNKSSDADWRMRVVPEKAKGEMTLADREDPDAEPISLENGQWVALERESDYFLYWIPAKDADGKVRPSARTFQVSDELNKEIASFVVKNPPSMSWKKESKVPSWYENFDFIFQLKTREDTSPMALEITADKFITD